ncbi:thiamine-phosphate kinase [Halothiobacillus diazotrophicus]|uniref:Thiamine-monophosphate kinase n=1 Tax=Halothiobacillus diazotrophicus TaxID=1860122 RepID=A0A191ZDN7_9GAMM|nr:thiamine-phosphate kinase [Halothiobacillus diazotrophicus]ANJ65983.1 thiamine-phosphate kinase [Halothiobacillus diazotrophicus]
MNEFALIRRYFARDCATPSVLLGVGDDCAILKPAPDEVLLVSTDLLVAGRHFPLNTAPEDIGHKALAVNLSDLAAMGAQPRGVTLGLALPEADPDWLAGFAEGFHRLAAEFGVCLIGGDTVASPQLTLAVTVLGGAQPDRVLRRDAARPGDLIAVTGTLGDAGLGLRTVLSPDSVPAELPLADRDYLRGRLDRPTPRLAEGQVLAGFAHAAIDVSDGLAQDLGHILAASGVGAEIDLAALPLSAAARRWLALDPSVETLPLTAGDDYELLFTLAPEDRDRLDFPATVIGSIRAEPGLVVRNRAGQAVDLARGGFDHFAVGPD